MLSTIELMQTGCWWWGRIKSQGNAKEVEEGGCREDCTDFIDDPMTSSTWMRPGPPGGESIKRGKGEGTGKSYLEEKLYGFEKEKMKR